MMLTGQSTMRKLLLLSFAMILATGAMEAQIGSNCPGEHPDLLLDKSGQQKWFASEQLEQMATKKVPPVAPKVPAKYQYQGDVSFNVLVNKQGDVACIWGNRGDQIFIPAANEAGRWWKFKPMVVDGKPVEFTGTMRFHFTAVN
jgi:hypothetical protein